jgi:hypothetical protein
MLAPGPLVELLGAVHPRLVHQAVDEGRLAMVDVGNNSNVTQQRDFGIHGRGTRPDGGAGRERGADVVHAAMRNCTGQT